MPVYLTSALGCASPGRTRDEALEAARRGFGGFKIQLGHPTLDQDLAAIRAARDALPAGIALMVDYVQSLTKDEAIRRGSRLDEEGLTWIEDPIPYRDLEGHAAIARALTTPIQLGENFLGPEPMAASIAAGASDLVMIDLPRIGGVTGWVRASTLAAEAGLKMSSHLYPEFAMQLMPATPTGHWLEYSDLVAPLLAERSEFRNGTVVIPNRPGAGIVWNEAALQRYDATT